MTPDLRKLKQATTQFERATRQFHSDIQLLGRIMGMMSENLQRYQNGQTLAYTDQSFEDIINGNHESTH